jgi:hypothetical protein
MKTSFSTWQQQTNEVLHMNLVLIRWRDGHPHVVHARAHHAYALIHSDDIDVFAGASWRRFAENGNAWVGK